MKIPKHSVAIRKRLFLVVLCCMAYMAVPARPIDLWYDQDTGRYGMLSTTLKLTGLGAYNPDDPRLFPKRHALTGLTRLRFDLDMAIADDVSAEIAYEHRAQRATHGAGAGVGGDVLTTFAPAPWRAASLDWQMSRDRDVFAWRHEIDRARVQIRRDWGAITAGRQAIGLGRGLIFSAVDVFSPFSPVEVDREWRRGVDAVRVEYQTSTLSSLEMLAVFGDRWDKSALLARYRGYMGEVDGEIIVGKRGRDAMAALVSSAVLGDSAVHGELAFFYTPERHPDGGWFGSDRLLTKAVLGVSHTFDVGQGLTLMGEYHYSGFGLDDVADATRRFRDPRFVERYMRGDSQILDRHGAALQALLPVSDTVTCGLLLLTSLQDGSGLASPSLTWTASETTTITVHGFAPWGASPRNGRLRSAYGASPRTLFAQASLYF